MSVSRLVYVVAFAFLGLILFDVFGLISGRTPFDHPAHLGGAAVGYFYEPFRVCPSRLADD